MKSYTSDALYIEGNLEEIYDMTIKEMVYFIKDRFIRKEQEVRLLPEVNGVPKPDQKQIERDYETLRSIAKIRDSVAYMGSGLSFSDETVLYSARQDSSLTEYGVQQLDLTEQEFKITL